MSVELLERAPVAPELSGSGSGSQPPEVKLTAVAAEPPEGERFDPSKVQPGDQFEGIVADMGRDRSELDTKFANITAGLGDVSLRGDAIAAAPHDLDPTSNGLEFPDQNTITK